MKLNLDNICLQKGMVHLTELGEEDNLIYSSTVAAKLLEFGYVLSSSAEQSLRYSSKDRIIEFYTNVIGYVKEMKGAKHDYKELHKSFLGNLFTAAQAKEISDSLEFYSNKGGFFDYAFKELVGVPIKKEKGIYQTLNIAVQQDVENIFTSIVSINTSIMPQDMAIVEWFTENTQYMVMPDVIPFKENLCTLAGLGMPVPVKTPTDVLRIAVHMSGGNISLPAVPPATKKQKVFRWGSPTTVINEDRKDFLFKKFQRKDRRYLLSLLEMTHCEVGEMVLKKERWIRLGEILHPGEYKDRFPKAFKAFDDLRNNKVMSWYGKLDKAYKASLDKALDHLTQRPGEFARRLDYIIRENRLFTDLILSKFYSVADKVSNKVIYELLNHFSKRDEEKDRYVTVKGKRSKTKLPTLSAMDSDVTSKITEMLFDVLEKKFSSLEQLSKVYIDVELEKIPLPTNMRSIDLTLKPTIRGQRTPINDKDAKVLRAFFRWEDKDGSLDPDLSATFVSKDKADVCSYSRKEVGKTKHSGDIIARQGVNAEYVDIDVEDAKDRGYQYVVLDVRNYRGGSLEVMDGYFGVMERTSKMSRGISWKPDTIANCVACRSEATSTLMSIIDLHTMEYIFLDVDSTTNGNTAYGDMTHTLEVIKQYSELPRFSVHKLLTLHANARGTVVKVKEEADVAFESVDFMHDYVKTGSFMGI